MFALDTIPIRLPVAPRRPLSIERPPLPLKHTRYPHSKEKRMTIAAGFLCAEGVLLCADTEVAGWTLKHHDSKLRHFDCPGGNIGFAISGNMDFALAAIDKCASRLMATQPDQ